jgi:hypothetical protein
MNLMEDFAKVYDMFMAILIMMHGGILSDFLTTTNL